MRWTPLAVALLVQAALLLWRLDRLPIWGDEQFTLDLVAAPWSEIADKLRRDIHPPLYFALAKLWAALPLPGSDVVRLRAFSAVTMLGATVALDRLILTQKTETARRWTLAAWALAPAGVLYARMARSYALQTLLALAALYAAARLLEKPARRSAVLAGLALAALLYTHYLPGLAIAAALAVAAIPTRRVAAAASALSVAGLAYAPWAVVLFEGIGRAANKSVYAITGSWLAELPVRAAYSALGLFAGEAHTVATFGFSAIVCAGVAVALGKGWRTAEHKWLLAVAAAAGFLGAAKWVSFPFMPARLLWLLPWLLTLAVSGALRLPRPRASLAAWLALLAMGQVFYARQIGFLNKGYLFSFPALASSAASPSGPLLVLADATNFDPSALRREGLFTSVRPIATSEDVAAALQAAVEAAGPIWRIRASRDISPNRIQDELDRRLLEAGFRESEQGLQPYSKLDRLLLRAMGDPNPPSHRLLFIEYRRDTR